MVRIITDYLEDTYRKYPNKVAFSDECKSLTFAQVRQHAMQVASWLIDNRIFKKPIAIYMEKSVDELVAFLGCAYSGNFYTPIDVEMPSIRIASINETLQPEVVITKKQNIEKVTENFGNIKTICLEDMSCREAEVEKVIKFTDTIIDTDVLYVLFTSGSTGKPKGVIISHKSVIDYTEWVTKTFKIDESHIFGNQAPFHFDNSILDIYQTLKTGAEMNIIPEGLFSKPEKLLDYLQIKGVNIIFWVPSALCLVANSGILEKKDTFYISKILFCGEVMPNKQLNMWRKNNPNALYANLYGPTEITDVCTYYVVDRKFEDDESLPIGYPCKNTNIFVLDEHDYLITSDNYTDIGELCVRGICLSYGYYNNPERTKEAFVQNPLNSFYNEIIYRTGDLVKYNERGEIIYLGRKDFQIKVNGFRIELGEIETAISAAAGIENNACIFDEEKQQIVCFYTGYTSKKEIRDFIRKLIPRYMMPHRYVKLEIMPLNVNGKVDRQLLKKWK